MGKYYDSSDKNIIKKGETAFFKLQIFAYHSNDASINKITEV
jgi:hypothetical protein